MIPFKLTQEILEKMFAVVNNFTQKIPVRTVGGRSLDLMYNKSGNVLVVNDSYVVEFGIPVKNGILCAIDRYEFQ
jgi:hypothetical protein